MDKDSDSVKSKIEEDEKNIGDVGDHANANGSAIPYDPDQGLSEEEKAQIV